LSFYLDGSKARVQLISGEDQRDQFHGFNFYDVADQRISKVGNNIRNIAPVLLYRRGMNFVRHVLAVKKPYFLRFSANEPNKARLYSRIAQKISIEHGYFLTIDGLNYNLYRQVCTIRDWQPFALSDLRLPFIGAGTNASQTAAGHCVGPNSAIPTTTS
jgi:hypothetical protein